MAAPTIAEIRARIGAILATYSGIGTNITDGSEPVVLPAYDVIARGAQFEKLAQKRYRVARTYEVYLLAAVIEREEEAIERPAIAIAESYLHPVMQLLLEHPYLELTGGSPVALVSESVLVSDDGAGRYPFRSRLYAAARITLTVTIYL